MDKFTASNGVSVERRGFWVCAEQRGGTGLATIGTVSEVALREFFAHERDVELGRWRWPEHPEYVVYLKNPSDGDGDEDDDVPGFRVVHEKTGRSREYDTAVVRELDSLSLFAAAARAYLAAHPEPKPWHDAKPGEVWLLMFPKSTQAWFVNGDYFQSVKTLTNIAKTDAGITAARRIFPEVSDD